MIHSIDFIHKNGSHSQNEDACVINRENRIFAAIDGATGFGGLSGDVASNIIKQSLENISEHSLREKVREGNKKLRLKTEELMNLSLANLPKHERSTCSLAAIQLNDSQYFEYVSYGDCMIILQYKDHSIRIVTHDHVDILDTQAITIVHRMLLDEQAEKGIDLNQLPEMESLSLLQEKKNKIKTFLLENRNKLNTYEGYGIIDGSEEGLKFMEYGVIPLINIKHILLLTDGLKMHTHQQDTGTQKNGWEQSAAIAFNHGINELYKQISQIEKEDPACIQYPRLKKHDDKTGILLTFK
ncbi:protein phosphatase 2C domain-containing protein [Heyndrickxia vini]|uniref:Protein phosphatase 2C domain-containing protein n=1 Tax=Heyndrickxia vini TaxID=1476025 RepID=A0ABX7E4F1_9BACI|nr:protein phosphatase 2C domain-containing protein [Heyndrickxia vini]QQZ10168.1 protein phosphatase 2C domain-containing protein [Heyndrickxia vini]